MQVSLHIIAATSFESLVGAGVFLQDDLRI